MPTAAVEHDRSAPPVARRRLVIAAILLLLLDLATVSHVAPALYRLNISPSMPAGFYVRTWQRPAVGRIVGVLPPAALLAYWQRAHRAVPPVLLKPVAAAAGDRVCRAGDHVAINDRIVPAVTIFPADFQGLPLPAWNGCRPLREGEVFVLASRIPTSLDSRYVGPVPAASIEGVYRPCWTF